MEGGKKPMPEHNSNTTDWHDRLIDAALDEVAGGQSPPDLTSKIYARVAADGAQPASLANKELVMATTESRNSLRNWVLVASVLVNLGLAGVLISGGDDAVVASNEARQSVEEPIVRVGAVDRRNFEPNGDIETDEMLVIPEELVPDNGFAAPSFAGQTEGIQIDDTLDAADPQSFSVNSLTGRGLSASGEEVAEQVGNGPTLADVKLRASPPPPPKPRRMPASKRENAEVMKSRLELQNESFRTKMGFAGKANHGPLEESQGLADNSNFDADLDIPYRYDSFSLGDGLNGKAGTPWGMARNGKKWPLGYLGPESREALIEQRRRAIEGQEAEGIGPGQAGDQYTRITENPFIPAISAGAVSTFSIDVDTASYANVRQFLLDSGSLPPPDAVRLEELVNYFHYDYEGPASDSDEPFAAHVEVAGCPWQPEHRLVRVGIKGREIDPAKRPKSNLVFLIDVSGSMDEPNKLPLVVHGMKQLARQLGENDRVAIVVYASSEGLVLESTPGDNQAAIVGSLERLNAGGSTAGGAGINLAYQIAEDNFIEGGTNRVILCTDGDFNVGTTNTADLERIVEHKAKDTRVFLSVIGFGRGNLNDEMMEKISGIGNGNYYYVDGDAEAERVFVRGMTGMLVTIAKDVKIQVEFNPAEVAGYRLLGYENRMLRTEDFNDDTKDAGEIGSGHTVTALYQVVPAGKPVDSPEVDPLKYQRNTLENETAKESGELLTLKMRYKQPDGDTSVKREWPVKDTGKSFKQADADMQFASAVAGFGMLLRDSRYRGDATFAGMREIAASSLGSDPNGERSEFLQLVTRALELKGEPPVASQPKE